jgi:hypothetical protein
MCISFNVEITRRNDNILSRVLTKELIVLAILTGTKGWLLYSDGPRVRILIARFSSNEYLYHRMVQLQVAFPEDERLG